MVKKLYKHEFEAYLRVWVPTQLVFLGIALLARLIQLFESETTVYNIINGSSIFAFVLALLVSVGLTFVFSIVRFYKNLFTGEGYLTFTLPVTPTQHILTKLFTAVAFQVATVLVALIGVSVITAGDVCVEVLKAIAYLWKLLYRELGVHLPFYTVEAVIFLIVATFNGLLLFYGCLAVGQLTNKNRVLLAVGVYFGYYFATQIFGTVLLSLGYATSLIGEIETFFLYHTREAIHWALCGSTVWYAALSVVYAFIIRHILQHKLNLE